MATTESLEVCLSKTVMDADWLGHYDKSDPVFHYPSPEGLLGILRAEGPVLWFSQFDSLNQFSQKSESCYDSLSLFRNRLALLFIFCIL